MFNNIDSEDLELSLASPEIIKKASKVSKDLITLKSKKIFEKLYSQFMIWITGKDTRISSFAENVLIVYHAELSIKMKASTL